MTMIPRLPVLIAYLASTMTKKARAVSLDAKPVPQERMEMPVVQPIFRIAHVANLARGQNFQDLESVHFAQLASFEWMKLT